MAYVFHKLEEKIFKRCDEKLLKTLTYFYNISYKKCSKYKECMNPVFENLGECALHCSSTNITKKNKNKHARHFNLLLREYIFYMIRGLVFENNFKDIPDSNYVKSIYYSAMKPSIFIENKKLKDILNSKEICIKNIIFPSSTIGFHSCDYILKEFKKIQFESCIFNDNLIVEENFRYYEGCAFNNNIEIKADTEYLHTKDKKDVSYSPALSSLDEDEYRYKECVFKKDVSILGQEKINYIYYKLFRNCDFKKNVNIENIKIRSDFINISNIFEYIKIIGNKYKYEELICKYKNIYSLNDIFIKNCNFDSSFKFNGIDIDYIEKNKKDMDNYNVNLSSEIKDIFSINSLIIKETKFNEKFELKNCTVININFEDSNIKGIFDVYKSSFVKARFFKSIFEEFAAFEYVVFGDGFIKNKTDFIYVTFKDFSNFRDTYFRSGLNFSRANMKQDPNFLNAKLDENFTDRETLRIIKNSFEKVNNKIESNRFFIYEMNSYKQENEKYISDVLTKFIVSKNSFFAIFLMCIMLFVYFVFGLIATPIILLLTVFRVVFKSSLGLIFTYIILMANQSISGFGKSYIRPIVIFLFSIVFYTYILEVHKGIFSEKLVSEYIVSLRSFVTKDWFVCLSEFLNACAANVPLFSKALEKKSGVEFISLIFFIWFGILTWQIIVSVKRNTQH